MAEHVIYLSNGRVIAQGSVSTVLDTDTNLADKIKREKKALTEKNEHLDEQLNADEMTEKKVDGKLVLAEELAEGTITWAACKSHSRLDRIKRLTHIHSQCNSSSTDSVVLYSGLSL